MILLALAAALPQPCPDGWYEVSPAVCSDQPGVIAEPPRKPDKDERCVKRWRVANYAAHGADVASTLVGLGRGANEANPIIRGLFGKKPKAHELIAFKLATIGLFEFSTRNSDDKCRALKFNTALTVGVTGLNLRFLF